MDAPSIITLTSDFGLSDPYVAAMKGVILSIDPAVTIVDVTHDIRPQQVEEAVFLLEAAAPYFPEGTVHVVVVDPGVGTERRALAVASPAGYFVGPDNGVLAVALPETARVAGEVALPDGMRAVAIEPERLGRGEISMTFHGRDVFAPAAAHLALGVRVETLGEPVRSLVSLPPFRAKRDAGGALAGRVVHVDRFGNLVTDVRASDLARGAVSVEIAGRRIDGLSATYGAEKGRLVALIDSSGYLEIAVTQGSAADMLEAHIGTAVGVRDGRVRGQGRPVPRRASPRRPPATTR